MRVIVFGMICMGFLCAYAATANGNGTPVRIHETCGDMEFTYIPGKGVLLDVFGIPVIKGSSIWVMGPDWPYIFDKDQNYDFVSSE